MRCRRHSSHCAGRAALGRDPLGGRRLGTRRRRGFGSASCRSIGGRAAGCAAPAQTPPLSETRPATVRHHPTAAQIASETHEPSSGLGVGRALPIDEDRRSCARLRGVCGGTGAWGLPRCRRSGSPSSEERAAGSCGCQPNFADAFNIRMMCCAVICGATCATALICCVGGDPTRCRTTRDYTAGSIARLTPTKCLWRQPEGRCTP